MRCIIVLFLCTILLFSLGATDIAPRKSGSGGKTAPAGKHDLRKVRWGMSAAQVRRSESPLSPRFVTRYQLQYMDKMFSENATVIFSFSLNRLSSVTVTFHPAPPRTVLLYNALLKGLQGKYGKAKGTLRGRYGAALYQETFWKLKRTGIKLISLTGMVKITYTGLKTKGSLPGYSAGSGDIDKL